MRSYALSLLCTGLLNCTPYDGMECITPGGMYVEGGDCAAVIEQEHLVLAAFNEYVPEYAGRALPGWVVRYVPGDLCAFVGESGRRVSGQTWCAGRVMDIGCVQVLAHEMAHAMDKDCYGSADHADWRSRGICDAVVATGGALCAENVK